MFSLSMLNWHIMFWGSLSGLVVTLIMSKRIKMAKIFLPFYLLFTIGYGFNSLSILGYQPYLNDNIFFISGSIGMFFSVATKLIGLLLLVSGVKKYTKNDKNTAIG